MAPVSPTLAGFRAAFRRPSLTFAEITWRWSVGATSLGLLAFALFEYLDSLPVTGTEAFLLRSRQPVLAGQAIAHILRGSLQRATLAALAAATGLCLLWIFAASLGRLVTVRALLDYFANILPREDAGAVSRRDASPQPLGSLFGLNFLRVAVVLASLLAFRGGAALAGFASPEADPRPEIVFLLFLPLAALIFLAWWGLNWFLSLAQVFAVRDGAVPVDSLFAAITFVRQRPAAIAAVSIWTGLAHLCLFFGATSIVVVPLGLIKVAPARLVVVAILLVTLIYFAVADWFYMVRLAGYVCIAEMPDPSLAPQSLSPHPPPQTAIDRDEPILSDAPASMVSG